VQDFGGKVSINTLLNSRDIAYVQANPGLKATIIEKLYGQNQAVRTLDLDALSPQEVELRLIYYTQIFKVKVVAVASTQNNLPPGAATIVV
jgi:hypothetical protein